MSNQELSDSIDFRWGVEINCDDLELLYYLEGYPYGYNDKPAALFIPKSLAKTIEEGEIFDKFEKLMLLPIANKEDLDIAYSSVSNTDYTHILLGYIQKCFDESFFQHIVDYNFYAIEIYDKIKSEIEKR